VAPQHDATLEPEQEVFADRFHRFERSPVDDSGHARHEATRVRALGLHALADKNLEARSDPVQRVSLGHLRA
jgi:hypothetical protein